MRLVQASTAIQCEPNIVQSKRETWKKALYLVARFVAVDFVEVDFVEVDCVVVGFVASGSVAWDYSPDDCCLELTNSKPI